MSTKMQDQRRETRERLLACAVAEFSKAGVAAGNIGTIVSAAGVARGTFYFHFPTREHVLFELRHREETRMAAELARFTRTPRSLLEVLRKTVSVLEGTESRLGRVLFRDLLAVQFSPSGSSHEVWSEHPFLVALVEELGTARERGEVTSSADDSHLAVFYLLGLHALMLTTPPSRRGRAPILGQFLLVSAAGMTVNC